MLPATGIENPLEAMENLGLSSVELAVDKKGQVSSIQRDDGRWYALSEGSEQESLLEKLASIDASICAFLMANDFSSDDFEREVRALTDVARIAEEMNVPVVRVDLVPHRGEMDEADFIRNCIRALGRVLGDTSRVEMGIENHGNTSNRPAFLDRVLDGVGDERLGVTLDTGNFYWFGHPLEMVYHLMEKYAPRVKHTHLKNISYPEKLRQKQREMGYRYGDFVCPIYEGDVDHRLVVQILAEAGYDRSLCIEDESLGQFSAKEKAEVLREDVNYLKSLV